MHISGTIVSGGTPLTLDLHLVRGKGGTGHMSRERRRLRHRPGRRQGVHPRLGRVLQGSSPAPTAAALLKGKWLEGSATTGQLAALTTLTDLQQFFSGALDSHGTLTKGAETTVNGQKVVAIKDNAKGGTLFVATTGKPYPIELQSPANGKDGTVNFDDWNKTVTIVAPKGAIDISKLKG